MAYPQATIDTVQTLYEQGQTAAQIETQSGVPPRTQRHWQKKFDWSPPDFLAKTETKYLELLEVEQPSAAQLNKMERLHRLLLKHNQPVPAQETGNANTLPPATAGKPFKNDFRAVDLDKAARPEFYQYQKEFLENPAEDRFILKSRQVGYSFVQSWEALARSLQDGKDKIFISASMKQLRVIRNYIKQFALRYFNVKLTGTESIEFFDTRGDLRGIYFLATNSATTQSYSGDVYFDEFCWIPRVQDILDTAKAMTTLDGHRLTYVSTPSFKSHPAFNIWAGLDENGKPQEEPDGIHRLEVNIHTALEKGAKNLSIEKLKRRFSKRQFDFLFMCQWIDDAHSIFKMEDLEKCYHHIEFTDENGKIALEPAPLPPWKNEGFPLYMGYDPNGGGPQGDTAGLVIGEDRGEKLRIIHTASFEGYSIDQQTEAIQQHLHQYQPCAFVMDITGPGLALWHPLKNFGEQAPWPIVMESLQYHHELKAKIVWHLERIVAKTLLEFDSNDRALMQAFFSIKTARTSAGRTTFESSRQGNHHGDLFWATAHLATYFQVEGSMYSEGTTWSF